jgi:hypothetical protein
VTPAEGGGRAANEWLRHALATMVYRGGKTLRGAPEGFSSFRIADGTRTPGAILAHVGDLLDWALELAHGRHAWNDSPPLAWDAEIARFFRAAQRLDVRLATDEPLGCAPGRLFQGPIADALAHFGQLAMLRRLAGAPIKGENYFKADIAPGRVGPEQATPRVEFD